MVARALTRSTNPTVRAAGLAAAGADGLTAGATATFAGATAANDIAYQRRMEEVGAKYGFTPKSRGQRLVDEAKQKRRDIRGEARNFDRPLDGKPVSELKLPDYRTATKFAEATRAAFPGGTQFMTKVARSAKYEFQGEKAIEIPTANVSHRFVKGGMTGEISRNFYRDKAGDLVASHDGFVINGEGKGGGIGKQVLKAQFDEYERMGVSKVKVHANIDVSGYAWARFGFVPSQQSWDELRASMKFWINSDEVTTDGLGNEYQPLNIPQRQRRALTRILDNPDPKGIWKIADARIGNRNIGKELLMERDWEGEIRLDDADAMARFNHYTGRSK
ncbi:hypothetical protein JL100_016235 [Skermanella mucosa]|uniref:hypothetical protein n=1 Tax=Skermanella mucosa TaxID=1789672 RepID=UPI00192CE2CD|nr:hypothetical protein [Skermanella mucosa]UEM18666.1 hypothetical protein JL100_016235 [Skermanella mucosa]